MRALSRTAISSRFAKQMPKNSLRYQIHHGFSRVLTRYTVLSSLVLLCLIGSFELYVTHRNLESQSDLIRTQLNTEITATLTQADTLTHSPILWTGLMDSFSQETVLKPLFSQLNRVADQRFSLLDYQGRIAIDAPGLDPKSLALVRAAIPNIKPDGFSVQLLRTDTANNLLLTLLPIMSPLSDAPLGYLMTEFSVTASVQKLNVDRLMDFEFNLEPVFAVPDWWKLRAVYKDQIHVGDLEFSYDTRYAISLIPDLLALIGLFLITALLGYLFLNRVERWLDAFSRQLTYQLDQLVSFARDVFTGVPVKVEAPANSGNEINTVMKALETLLSEQALSQERLRKLAYEDALTGLPTFSRFLESLESRLIAQEAHAFPLMLLFMDIDKLKHINDIYGYAVGDLVVQHTANTLKEFLPEPRVVSRRTGDEFIAWVEMDIVQLESIIESITRFDIEHQGVRIPISLTVGAASYPQDAQSLNDLIFCAEYALRQAKQRARQSFVIFDKELGQRLIRTKQIEERISAALHECAIVPFYQPEVDMVTGEITGVEALARWHDPILGWIAPDEFLPIVEHLRLSSALTACVLSGILEDIAKIRAYFPGAKIAFNASPQDFHGNQLIQIIESYVSTHGPQGLAGLELELTEQDIVDLDVDLLGKLGKLIDMGIRIAIDDFGTRYSSLSRLTALPLHRLKIDYSFVANVTHEKGEEVVRLIISLAKALNLDITAEGVETIQQRDLLIQFGCVHAQGWLFKKALPLSDLIQLPKRLDAQEAA